MVHWRLTKRHTSKLIRGLGAALESLLFPNACALCGEVLSVERCFCDACERRIPPLPPHRCRICARPLPPVRGEKALCLRCRARRPAYRSAIAATRFRHDARDLVHRYKYRREQWLVGPLSARLARALRECDWLGSLDAVSPIPLHWRRARSRTFDQADTLARELARHLELPFLPCLRRSRATRPQVTLPREARRRNLEGAFELRRGKVVEGRIVLLVDDVLTSGATADAATRALRLAGARRVHVAAFAR